MIKLRGITWAHTRGLAPLKATAAAFELERTDVEISWTTRSLHDFGRYPVDALAAQYDLVVLDHPWVGFIAETDSYLPLDDFISSDELTDHRRSAVGPSHDSYQWNGRQWALAIDAATPCASYRPDLLEGLNVDVPQDWEEVVELGRLCVARGYKMGIPLGPVDAVTAFLSLASNLGDAPFSTHRKVVDRDVGLAVLRMLTDLLPYCCPDVFQLTPILLMDRMSETDELAYCPHAYNYSNYSRPNYRQHLCNYGDMPGGRDRGPAGSHLGGTGLGVSKQCRYPELAVQYAARVAGSEWQKTIYFDAGGQPAHADAWDAAAVNAKCNNFFFNTRRTIEQAFVRPRYNGYIHFQYDAGEILSRHLAGRGSANEALDHLDALYAAAPAV